MCVVRRQPYCSSRPGGGWFRGPIIPRAEVEGLALLQAPPIPITGHDGPAGSFGPLDQLARCEIGHCFKGQKLTIRLHDLVVMFYPKVEKAFQTKQRDLTLLLGARLGFGVTRKSARGYE